MSAAVEKKRILTANNLSGDILLAVANSCKKNFVLSGGYS
jgi:hypothetical protein